MVSESYNRKDILNDLINIVGEENATAEECDLICYEKDYSLISTLVHLKPDFVVHPETTENVSEIVRLANRRKIPLVPRGGGTGMWGGTVPLNGGIVLDMRKMDRIIDVDIEKRTITVQSGILIRNLAIYLEKHGFFLADKPESWFAATIGARTQGNGVGYYYNSRYGKSTDQIVCLEVVLPTGEVIKTGPSKVYDPTLGYDLTKLFSGAEGTLGIITQVTLKIYRIPEHRIIETFEFPSYRDSIKAVMDIRDSGIIPETLETMDETNYQSYSKNMCEGEASSKNMSKNKGVLVIGFAGLNELVSVQRELTRVIFNRFGGSKLPDNFVESYQMLKETYPVNPFPISTASNKKPVKYILDAIVPLESTAGLVDIYHNLVDRFGVVSHGIAAVHCAPDLHSVVSAKAYVDERKEEEINVIKKMEDELFNYVKSVGGGIGGSGGLGMLRLSYGEDQYGSTLNLVRKLKQSLDPNNIINPGKKVKST